MKLRAEDDALAIIFPGPSFNTGRNTTEIPHRPSRKENAGGCQRMAAMQNNTAPVAGCGGSTPRLNRMHELRKSNDTDTHGQARRD